MSGNEQVLNTELVIFPLVVTKIENPISPKLVLGKVGTKHYKFKHTSRECFKNKLITKTFCERTLLISLTSLELGKMLLCSLAEGQMWPLYTSVLLEQVHTMSP